VQFNPYDGEEPADNNKINMEEGSKSMGFSIKEASERLGCQAHKICYCSCSFLFACYRFLRMGDLKLKL
jgi:hypothetical protein